MGAPLTRAPPATLCSADHADAVRWRPAAVVQALVARAMLGADGPDADDIDDGRLGDVRLLPHQRDAVLRLRRVLREHGGALLADAVGLGKTYVALALARAETARLVVAPAALRATWADACARSAVRCDFVSIEALSRGAVPAARPAFVVVDESHHLREPRTRRYRALASLCRDARVLLLSATPLHNRRADLAALLALFLGERARALDDAAMAALVVRRGEEDVTLAVPMPPIASVRWLRLPPEDDVLEALVALPPPVPPADGGDAGALVRWTLVRQWASSRAALVQALRRRLARAVAIEASLEQGAHPTHRELAAWRSDGDAMQLAWPELVARPAAAADDGVSALLGAVRAHREGVSALLARLRCAADPDVERAALLRELRARHADERIVAFAEFEATVAALFRHLREVPGVAMLSARGARVCGGELSRAQALERFAPTAHRRAAAGAAHDVRLLLATEILSEGIDLRDATVVVHLDLPWSPVRLEQRVGRLRRLGASRPIHVYAVSPPAAAERLLALERRLRRKARLAERTVGLGGSVLRRLLPGLGDASAHGAPEAASMLRRLLAEWSARAPPGECDGCGHTELAPVACGAAGAHAGALVLARRAGGTTLLALRRGALTSDSRAVLAVARAVRAHDVPPRDGARLRAVQRAFARWAARQALDAVLAPSSATPAATRQRALRRLASVSARIERHRRAEASALVGAAHATLLAPLGADAERALRALVGADLPDREWLEAVAALGRREPADRVPEAPWRLAAVLLIEPEG